MVTKKSPKTAAPVVKATSSNFAPSARITLTKLGESNPKRPNTGAHQLYACYGKGNLTVGAYLAAVAKTSLRPKAGRVALAWDLRHGFIKIA
jgi:hypothetical protein